MVPLFMPGIREKDVDRIDGARLNTSLQHLDSVVSVNAQIVTIQGEQLIQKTTNARPMYLYSNKLRFGLSQRHV
jgi:hypothetical protein